MKDSAPREGGANGIRQIVAHTWRPGVSDQQRDAFHAAVLRLADIPQVRSVSAGCDLRFYDDNWDYVSVIDFADTEAAKRYAEHPLHQAFVTEHAIPLIDQRAVVQYPLTDMSQRPI
jgi:Stress responsive A/B Barrel Domain